jgi:hypothetical protein
VGTLRFAHPTITDTKRERSAQVIIAFLEIQSSR